MIKKLKLFWSKLKGILHNRRGSADDEGMEFAGSMVFTPCGYKFLKSNIEKYAVQLAMLNRLFEQKLISAKEHALIKGNLIRKYSMKKS